MMSACTFSAELLIWQDIPKSLRGVPKIQVTFTIDTNGILQVGLGDRGRSRFCVTWTIISMMQGGLNADFVGDHSCAGQCRGCEVPQEEPLAQTREAVSNEVSDVVGMYARASREQVGSSSGEIQIANEKGRLTQNDIQRLP